ncbi:MAG: 30S ribosomal protein S18 [Candidatus Poribacteria bacterium]|nr:30S ribosomal protein S18 [Candidatus Poribacteria bacterium]
MERRGGGRRGDGRRGDGRRSEGRGREGFRRGRRKRCRFCMEKIKSVDYKSLEMIRSFTTDRGKILPRRVSGNCAKHQRMVTGAVKRARNIALLPFTIRQ